MRAYSPCNVLLIDDDPAALDFTQVLLAESKPAMDAQAMGAQADLFRVVHVEQLASGLAALAQTAGPRANQAQRDNQAQREHQIVLLDLNLPDSQGIESLVQVRRAYPLVPIIVLTGMEDEVIAVQAIELGAQGFLNKENLDPNLLAYALLLALDRQRQLQASGPVGGAVSGAISGTGAEAASLPDRSEIESFERLAYSVRPATVTSTLFESGLLKDAIPDIWLGLVDTYIQILDLVLDQKTFRVEHPISQRLRALAEQLGFLKAGARDVVELHTFALRKKGETESVMKTKVYAAEGRLIVLELMGYLATYYRKYFIGLSKMNASMVRQFQGTSQGISKGASQGTSQEQSN